MTGLWTCRSVDVITATLALLAGICLVSCNRPAPKPVLPGVSRDAFADKWTDRKVVLLGLGDSITDGFGASEGHGYFDMLTRNPKGDSPDMIGVTLSAVIANLKVHNLSMSYSTSVEHLSHQISKLPVFPSDTFGIVCVTSGGNDCIHDYGRTPPRDGAMYGATLDKARPWIAAFEKRLGAILDGVDKSFPGGCEIFLANIYDPTDGVGDIEHCGLPLPRWPDGLKILTEMNAVIERAAASRKNIHIVDIRSEFLGHGIHCRDRRNPYYHKDDPSYWYYENLEDPNDTGYDAIRRLYLGEIARVFGNIAPTAPAKE